MIGTRLYPVIAALLLAMACSTGDESSAGTAAEGGTGSEPDPAAGGGSPGGGYFEQACTAVADCQSATDGSGFQACCTASGQCGVTYDDGRSCDTGCGFTPCLAAPAGEGCCDVAAMCGETQADGTCWVEPSRSCGTTPCGDLMGHPGCCLSDGRTCGNLYRGACTPMQSLVEALSGSGGTEGGWDDPGPMPLPSVACGANTCQPLSFGGFEVAACCKDAAVSLCGYVATLLDPAFSCATQQEILSGFMGGDAGVPGPGSPDASANEGVCEEATDVIAETFPSAEGGCCLTNGTCGVSVAGKCKDALTDLLGEAIDCIR